LKILNLFIQGKVISIFHVQDKLSAMIIKLELWGERLSRGEMDSFNPFMASWSSQVLKTIKGHLEGLKRGLRKHFLEPDDSLEWIRNPFPFNVQTLPNNLSASEEQQFLELASDGFLRTAFQQKTLTTFVERSFRVPCQSEKSVILCRSPQV
jgi:hypothetical protein